jgi:hypothetical protein
MPKQDRKKTAELLLEERLGLSEDWLNRDQDGAVHLPSALPEYLTKKRSKQELKSLEEDLHRLVAAGCRKQALYFCIAQLSPEAERFRAGWEPSFDAGGNGEDGVSRTRKRPPATRQDLEGVANKAAGARRLIHKYRNELLRAAEMKQWPLPGGMFTEFASADEALSVVTNSLTWVCNLAESYAAPFETTLLKSKGLLYLTLYASMYADVRQISSQQRQAASRIPPNRRRERGPKRDILPPDNALASVVSCCTGKQWALSDLHGKINRFQADHPALHARMKSKLAELHDNARE